jgi:hypothetical protein
VDNVSESSLPTLKVGSWPIATWRAGLCDCRRNTRESFQEMLTAAPGFEIAYLHIKADWEESVRS